MVRTRNQKIGVAKKDGAVTKDGAVKKEVLGGTLQVTEPAGDNANETLVHHDRTRRQNMPAKKQGAGGKFTWGGLLDVTDFAPLGQVHANVRVGASSSSSSTANSWASSAAARAVVARRAEIRPHPVQMTRTRIADASHFPALPLRPIDQASEDLWVLLPPTPRQVSPESSAGSVAASYGSVAASAATLMSSVSAWGSAMSTRHSAMSHPASPASFTLPSPAMSLSASPRTFMPTGFPLAYSPPGSPEPVPFSAFSGITLPQRQHGHSHNFAIP